MSWRAVNKLNKESNDHFHWIPLRVLRVRMQLVAGMKYKLEILIGQSNCAKNVGQIFICIHVVNSRICIL
uniref:Cystatin domain-containing protein n=1 Tax=Ascaris lumbricoides TaxID=6252 RepID=A0A0M3HJR3_ASCLU